MRRPVMQIDTAKSNPESAGASPLSSALAMLLALTPILWAAEVPANLGYPMLRVQFAVLILGLGLCLCFLHVDARGIRGGRSTGMDYLLAVLSFAVCLYILFRIPRLVQTLFVHRLEAIWLSAALLLLTLEGVRRVLGYPILLLVMAFLAYVLLGHHAPGVFQTLRSPVDTVLIYSVLGGEALIGPALIIVGSVVLIYIVFGQYLVAGGGGRLLTDFALMMAGRNRAAPAKIAVLSSGVLGSISGSVSANVVATGSVTIPLMQRIGIPRSSAGGIEAVASTGGQLMPPVMGAAAFLMVEFIGIPYVDIIAAAFLPALLFYAVLSFRTDHLFGNLPVADPDILSRPKWSRIVRGSPVFLLPFIGIIVALFVWNRSPVWAGMLGILLAIASSVVFSYGGDKLTFKSVWRTLIRSGYAAVDIVIMGAAAGIMLGALNMTGLGAAVGVAVSGIVEVHLLPVLVLTALAALVLGMGLPTTAIYVVVASLLAPSLIDLGVTPLAAHLFVFYTGMLCMITPPIAFASFAAAAVSGAGFFETAIAAVRFAWPAYLVPFLFVLSPPLLLDGTALQIVHALVFTLAGLWFISASASAAESTLPHRLLQLLTGVALVWPQSAPASVWFNGIGLLCGAYLFWKRFSQGAMPVE